MVPPVHVDASDVQVPALPVTVKLPVVLERLIPLAAPFDEMLVKVNVPPVLESETAVPVLVAMLTSLTLTPVMAAPGSFIPVLVVELIWRPLTTVFVLRVTVLVMFVMVALPLFIAGKVSLPVGGVVPVSVIRLAVASW